MGRKEAKPPAKELASIPTSNKLLIQNDSDASANSLHPASRTIKRVWRMCPFRNPARSDGLILKHWRQVDLRTDQVRTRVDNRVLLREKYAPTLDSDLTSTMPRVDEEMTVVDSYTFAKVAPAIKIYRYSDEFYRYQIGDLDPSWTKEETDLLFDLCEMFELRFIAIHDRFKWRKDISLERLKHRYYTVTKRIVEFSFEEKVKAEMAKHSNPNHPVVVALREESARHPLVKYVYNIEHDRERRIMLDRSFRVTEEQKEMEAELLNEIKEAESLFKREERKKGELRKLKRKFNVSDDIIPLATMEMLHAKDVWLASDMVANYKSHIHPKHNEAVDDMLSALNIPAPVVSSRASNELYCVVRGDAAIMINLVNKVDSLRKELEHWKVVTGSLPEQSTTPRSNDEKPVLVNEAGEIQTAYQTPRTIVTPKLFPATKPAVPQHMVPQPQMSPDSHPVLQPEQMKLFPDQLQQLPPQQPPQSQSQPSQQQPQQHQDVPTPNMIYQQQMVRQRIMMAQQGPSRQHVYPMKMSPTGASSPHGFQQQGHFGHMMPPQGPQHIGQQSPMGKQRPSMHQMPQQGMPHPHPMMQARVMPPRMMQYPPYSQHAFPPGYQQQFSPMPMRAHPQGVYFPNQMYPQGPQPPFTHMVQHPMSPGQGMHMMGQQNHQMQHIHAQGHIQGQMSPQGQMQNPMQGPLSGQMSPQGHVTPQGNMPGQMQQQGNVQGQPQTQQGSQSTVAQQSGMGNGQQMSPHLTRSA
ncbi:DNA methyltransferase 1-associated protein 1 domain containing protein [Babesia gibsoni]|uniref:DNA methyltransferase 1-associated protein 1 domain containing protein n=1 Tax=Babesia gibsoni TaxID=33632 RepID=A0AAD8LI50_BABGI|nr:DNA methyltransferase 1-associated protein 1 domain containing protein [Babesia gibsoni]